MAIKSFKDWQNDKNGGSSNTSSDSATSSFLPTYKDWADNNNEYASTTYNSFSQNRAQQATQRFKEQEQRRINSRYIATSKISDMVNNYITGFTGALRSGTFVNNAKAWNDQYKKITDYLNKYSKDLDPTAVTAMKTQLNNTWRLLGQQTSNLMPGATWLNNQKAQPTQPTQPYNVLANPNAPAQPTSPTAWKDALTPQKYNIPSPLERKTEEQKRDYYIGKGAPLNNYTPTELAMLQNLYEGRVQNQENTSKSYAPDQKRAESYNAPGMNDPAGNIDSNILKPYLRSDQIGTFKRLGSRTEQMDYLAEKGVSDSDIEKIMEQISQTGTPTVADNNNPLRNEEAVARTQRNALNNVTREIGRREFQQKYADNFTNDDFEEKSQYSPTGYDNSAFPRYNDQQTRNTLTDNDLKNMFYESVNGNQKAYEFLHFRESENGEKVGYSNILDQYGNGNEKYMTRDEIAMFNYLWAKDKEEGTNTAMEYYNELQTNELDRRASAEIREEYEQWAKEDPFMSNLLTTLTKPFTAIASIPMQVYDLATTGHINADKPQYAYVGGVNTVRNKTAEMITDATGSQVWGDVYQGVMSAVDNAYGIALGGTITQALGITGQAASRATEAFTLSLMTTDAAQTAVLENIRNGMGEVDAIINGLAAGGIEFLTEKIGMDNLFNSLWKGKGAWISWVKQTLSEGGEEVLSGVLNDTWGYMYDQLRGIDVSDWRREMNEYIIENNLQPGQEDVAFNHVFKEHLIDNAKAFGMGALSGGILGGGALINGVQNTISERSIADMYGVNNPEQLRRVAELGTDFFNGRGATTQSADIYDRSQNILDRLDNGQNVSNRQARNLAVQMTQAMQDVTSNAAEVQARAQFVDRTAQNYRNSGRNAMAATLESFYTPGTDGSRYVAEMEQVYNRALAGKSIPQTTALTEQMVQAAVNAAEADANRLSTQTTNAVQNETQESKPYEYTDDYYTAEAEEPQYTPIEKTEEQMDTDMNTVLDNGEIMWSGNARHFAQAYQARYEDDMDVEAYTAGANAIYEQASQGVNLDEVVIPEESAPFFTETTKETLYNSAVSDIEGGANYVAETENGSGDISLSGGSERYDSQSSEVTGGSMAEGTGRTEGAGSYTTGNVRPQSQNAFNLTGKTATAKSLGIDGGNDSNQVQIVELADTADNRRLEQMAAERGLKVVAFSGNNLSIDGMKYGARGAIKGDSIYVRADANRHSAYQIGRHEIMHDELRTHKNQKIERVFNHLRAVFGDSFVDDDLIPAYKKLYKNANMGDLQIMEEIICDAYGGMNVFNNEDIPGIEAVYNTFLKTSPQLIQQTVTDVNETAEAVEEVNNNSPPQNQNPDNKGAQNTPNKMSPEEAKGQMNDSQFSIEFAPDIENRQTKFFNDNVSKLIFDEDIFNQAIKDTNTMVQQMIKHKEILPTDKVGKVLVKNGSYDVSVENTTICVRTLAYNQFVDMVQDKLDRPLTQMESFLVSQKMYDIAVDPQCLYCYVSLDRKAYNEFLGRYVDDRNTALEAYKKAGKPDVRTISKTHPLFVEFLHGRKATDPMLARYKSWLNAYNNGEHLLTKSDIKTDLKRSEIMQKGSAVEIAQLKDILAYAQSASWSKKQMDYVAYNGEILKMGARTVKNLNDHYGLRFYSFSDYSGAFIVENMQEVMDASLKGLKGLAYTKDVDFARIFADTGMNINISVFAKYNPQTEQYEIDPLQSANLEDAIALRNEKKNVGIVVVATDVEGVKWAMHQEWSDVVIPFHTVRTEKDVADFYNWEVFTGSQNDTVNPDKQNLWDEYVKSTGKSAKKVSKMIYPSEHNNDYDTYMRLIDERGLTPRFNEFRFDENGKVDPTYMKLVNETRQSAQDTKPMKPVFNLSAAEESFQKFVDKGGYFRGWYNDGVNVDAEAQTVADDILAGKTAKDVDYGRQDLDAEALQKSRKTNREHARFSEDFEGDDLSDIDDLLDLDILDMFFRDSEGQTQEEPETKKPRRVDEVNKRLKQIGLQFTGTDEAAWTDERIDKYLSGGYYGSSDPNYAQAHIAYMSPQEYLNLTMGANTATVDRIESESAEYGDINFETLGNDQPIRLYINKGRNGARVTGHEGRHRMMLLGRAGFSRVPVLIFDFSDKYSKTTLNNYTLRPQEFNEGDFISKGRNVTLSEMIPFSKGNRDLIVEKFGSGNVNASIRYSEDAEGQMSIGGQTLEDAAADLKERVQNLSKQNKDLTKKYEYFKGQTQLSGFTKNSTAWKNVKPVISENGAKTIAKDLISRWSSTIKAGDITADLQYWTTYLATNRGGKNTFSDVNRGILPIAEKLVKNAQMVIESDGTEILRDIRSTTIKIDTKTRNDIADYTEWRKAHMGRMNISLNTGTDITEFYQMMHDKWGESAFPADNLSASDQLAWITEFVDSYQPITQNPYSYDMAEAIQHAAFEIYDAMLNAPVMNPTFADKANTRMETLKRESQQKINDVRKAATERKNNQIQKIRMEYRESLQRRLERNEKATLRQNILKRAKRLKNMKMSAPNKALLQELIGNMNTDVATLTDKKKKKLTDLLAWVSEQEKNNPDFYVSDFIKKQLEPLNQDYLNNMIDGKDPDALNKLRQLNDALLELEHMIRNQHKLIDAQDRRDIRTIASEEIERIRASKGTKKGMKRTLDRLIIQGTLSPMRMIHRMIGYDDNSMIYKIAKDIDEGGIKALQFQHDASSLFDKWMGDKKLVRKWAGKNAETKKYNIVTADGKNVTIELTPMMRATLYLASKDGGYMRHMCGYDTPTGHKPGGGISLPNIKDYRKGNMEDAYDGKTVRITKSALDMIIADMTTEERAFADEVNKFLNGMQKEELNAVSNKIIGRDIAVVDDYLPIATDKRYLGSDYGAIKQDGTIEGAGNFKERVESNKPVLIQDLTDILRRSIDVTSKYVGLAMPVHNMDKIRKASLGYVDENGNYQSHEDTIDKAIYDKWGNTALDYLNKAMADIQNPAVVKEDLEKAFAKIRSKYAQSVLTLNLSVGLKQAASYPTAAAVVGWKPLAKAMGNWKHTDLDLIAKYTPLLWYRTKGYTSPDMASIKGNDDIWSNLPKPLNWITGIDYLTTRKLWKAAEYYVRDNNPGLYKNGAGIKGQTDAYYQKVAEIYNRIIEESQPNYTPWQRPQYLRSKSGVVQTLMMFKTQPMQNFNLLYDAIGNFRAKRTAFINNSTDAQAKAAFKEASRNLRWAVTSQIGQLITFAAMTMLWNMFRRKKEKWEDEDGNFSLEVLMTNMGKDIGSGIFGMLPFGSDVWSLVSSLAFGDTYYGFESVTDSALGDLGNAFKTAWDLGSELINSMASGEAFDFTKQKKKIKSVASAVSKLFGVPYDNIYNMFTALYKRGRDIFDNEYNADYYAIAWDDDPSSKKKDISGILYRAHKNGDMDEYNELRQILLDSGEWGSDDATPEEDIDKNVQTRFIEENSDPIIEGNKEKKNTSKQGLYDYMFHRKDTEEYQQIYDEALELGFTEEDINEGIRKSFAADLIGIDSKDYSNGDLYSYMLDLRETDKADYNDKYNKLTENGFAADEITDGLKKSFGQRVTGIVEDYKTSDLYNYLYEQMTTNNTQYSATLKDMADIGFAMDTVSEGVLKAYGQQLTGVSGDDFKVDAMWDFLYDLNKSNKSRYNTEIATVKKLGYDDEKISAKMKDAFGRSITGLSGDDYSSEALFTKLYSSRKGNFSSTVSEMKNVGFSEESIKTGLKNAYEAQLTGIPYSEAKAEDMYAKMYELYKSNSSKFATEYQNAINVGYTEKAIKDGIHKLMKAEYGVDNVKKLPHQFAAPEHTLPSWWTYKTEDKDEGAPKDSGYAAGSSWIGSVSYDNGELTVYENGMPYTYHGVPESVYEAFKSEGYRGKSFNKYINGKYPYN